MWLLFLSIFTHALVPAGTPAKSAAGSAFSASTSDVSLAPRRASPRADRIQLGADDRDGPAGDGIADEPVQGAESSALPSLALHSAPPAPRPTSVAAEGGAASFSARAPPSA